MALAVAACVLLLAGSVSAEPAPPRAALVVTRGPGAEDCPDGDAIAVRVHGMGGADVLASSPEAPRDTWIEIELSRVLSGYRAVISARGRRHGTRTIDDVGPSCASLGDAVAITLVMLLEPELRREAPSPLTAATAAPLVVPPADTPLPPPEKAPGTPRLLRPGGEAQGGATVAVLGHATPVLEIGARLGIGQRGAVALLG